MKKTERFYYIIEVPYMYFDEDGNEINEAPKKPFDIKYGWKSNYYIFFSSHKMKHFKKNFFCQIIKITSDKKFAKHYPHTGRYMKEKYIKNII